MAPCCWQEVGDESVGAVLVSAVADRYRGALIGEAARDRRADTAGAAGDEGHPAGQLRGRWLRRGEGFGLENVCHRVCVPIVIVSE